VVMMMMMMMMMYVAVMTTCISVDNAIMTKEMTKI